MRAGSACLPSLYGARFALAAASLALSGVLACASSTAAPPTPAANDPTEQLIASLAQALKLDAAQQQKTSELLRELVDRDDRIRAGWANGERVQPKALVESHWQFERDFVVILSEEQRKIYIENKTRLMLQARIGGPAIPH